MRLDALALRHFRNLRSLDIRLGPRFTVLSGPNGAGKTNILEALWFTSTLRSFRASNRATLIAYDQPTANIELRAYDTEFDTPATLVVGLERRPRGCHRKAQIDGKAVRSAREFYARVPMILFTAEDLSIVRGSPSSRRQFIDRIVFARDRQHISDVQAYDKLLRARNHILNRRPERESLQRLQPLLETYESGLANHGSRIWARRARLVHDLKAPFAACFAEIHDSIEVSRPVRVRYASRLWHRHPEWIPGCGPDDPPPTSETLQTALLRTFREGRSRDYDRGSTARGPHLDDLELILDGHDAAEHASQGQSRAMVLALKIAELRLWQNTPPVLLLDDVSSELDPSRNARLFELLANAVSQCVITTTSADFIQLGGDRADIALADGQVRAATALD